MATVIRLTRVGRAKSPHYRMVVADSRSPRDGRFIEILGFYQPLNKEESTQVKIDEERALYWLNVGAQPSNTARSILRKQGIMKKWHEAREDVKKQRKAEAASAPATDQPQG
ncbi:30S ribosomal protein S16 [bacterium]|nr:30S ribosomal protein S16 [bacterium]